jgi:hypothetical protein
MQRQRVSSCRPPPSCQRPRRTPAYLPSPVAHSPSPLPQAVSCPPLPWRWTLVPTAMRKAQRPVVCCFCASPDACTLSPLCSIDDYTQSSTRTRAQNHTHTHTQTIVKCACVLSPSLLQTPCCLHQSLEASRRLAAAQLRCCGWSSPPTWQCTPLATHRPRHTTRYARHAHHQHPSPQSLIPPPTCAPPPPPPSPHSHTCTHESRWLVLCETSTRFLRIFAVGVALWIASTHIIHYVPAQKA